MRSSLSTQRCIVSSLRQSLTQCTFAHQHPVWAALNVLVWYRHSLPCIYRIEKRKKKFSAMRQCCQQRSENYQQIAVKLRLSWTHLPPFSLPSWHLPFYITTPISQKNRWGISGWWWGICEMRNMWKGENSGFYTILQVDASAEEEDCPWWWGHGQAQPRIVASRKKERKKYRETQRDTERERERESEELWE